MMPLRILSLYLFSTLAAAQEASGLVVDVSDNSPLPFAHTLHTMRSIGDVTGNQGQHSRPAMKTFTSPTSPTPAPQPDPKTIF